MAPCGWARAVALAKYSAPHSPNFRTGASNLARAPVLQAAVETAAVARRGIAASTSYSSTCSSMALLAFLKVACRRHMHVRTLRARCARAAGYAGDHDGSAIAIECLAVLSKMTLRQARQGLIVARLWGPSMGPQWCQPCNGASPTTRTQCGGPYSICESRL